MIKSFQDLEVYQEGMDLSEKIELLVRKYPSYERYLLVDQSRRASRAVPALIAEAWPKRRSLRSFQKYLKDAVGECNEMMTHLEQAKRFGYVVKDKAAHLLNRYSELAARIYQLKSKWRNF